MSDNKVTLFHLLSATAANQNSAQKDSNPKVYDYAEGDSVDTITANNSNMHSESPAFSDTQIEKSAYQNNSDIDALFEESMPETNPAFSKEEIAFENERFEHNFSDEVAQPSWESSRSKANMQVFASNTPTTAPQESPVSGIADEDLSDTTEETIVFDDEPTDFTQDLGDLSANETSSDLLEEEEESELEYLDEKDNFNTEDIDEAYRQRLIALGLEPIETEAKEVEEEENFELTESVEDVDEALSQVFAQPDVQATSIEAATTPEAETEETTTVSEPFVREHFSPLDFHSDETTEGANAPLGNKTLGDENNQASLLQQFRQLQDRNSTFVFMFGRQQAGKTVILSSLAYHLGTDENGLLETRRRQDNLKGAAYLKQLSESVRRGQFMNRTAVGSLYELDLTYTPNKPEIPMNFTFLEMSGEDLTKVELSETSAGNLPSDIEVYLKCPNLNVVFMLVVPYEDAEEHDYLVIDFLDYLKERKPDFDYSKLLLLISKWDRYEGLRKDEVDMFVKEQMPRTYSRLKAKKATLARYSVGEVSDDNQQILELNTERPAVVKKWLYQASTGQKIKDESTSFWNKIKQWV